MPRRRRLEATRLPIMCPAQTGQNNSWELASSQRGEGPGGKPMKKKIGQSIQSTPPNLRRRHNNTAWPGAQYPGSGELFLPAAVPEGGRW